MKKLLLTTLLLCAGLAATAYEYQFNWAQMEQNAYTNERLVTTNPTSGIDIYINATDGETPYLYAWEDWNNNNKLTGEWPGTLMTKTAIATTSGEQIRCFKIHVNKESFKFIVSKGKDPWNNDLGKSQEVTVREGGSYFFDYDGTANTTLTQQRGFYSTPQPIQNKRIFVKNMDDENTPYVYAWTGSDNNVWPGVAMQSLGNNWYYADLPSYSQAIISKGGSNAKDNQTGDINLSTNGSTTILYYPSGSGQRYEPCSTGLLGATNNYKEWEFTPYMTINGNKASFTSTNNYGVATATLSIVCNDANDVNKVCVMNGELRFPWKSRVEVSVNDGSYLRELWIGKPQQGNNGFWFGNQNSQASDSYADNDPNLIRDIKGLLESNIYKINTGSNIYQTGEVVNWNPTYFLSDHVKVFSEKTSLEDLLYADGNVRLQYHMIDHPLVGVAVRNIQGVDYLIARSESQLSDAHRQKPAEGQRTLPYEWANPNMPQYGWIALKVEDPGQYVGKKFDNVRGTFCQYASYGEDTWIPWTNPNIVVTSELNILGDERTTLNTYSLANLVQPKDAKLFLPKPNLYELCNVHDVMRSHGDHFVYVPDDKAIMSEIKTTDADGNEIYISRNNVYVENGLDYGPNYSFASMLQWQNENEQYAEFQKAYVENDIKILGEGNLGLNWQLYDKVYDFNEALIVSAIHAYKEGYIYPLSVPVRDHMDTNGINNGKDQLVLHILGKGALQEYKTDMLVGNSDYWSRYKYSEDCNAYRNDVVFSFSKPSKNEVLGEMDLNRYDNKGNKTTIAKIVHTQDESGTSVTNNFTVTSLADSREAENDDVYAAINTARKPNYYDNQKIVMGYDQTTIPVTDMFYSTGMESRDHNDNISNLFTYKLEPAEGNTHEITTAVSVIPVYKTDVNVAGHSMYTKSEVDGDTDDHLQDDGKVKVYFTPNHATAVTRYDVLGGMDEGFGYAATKSSTDLVNIDATNFMDNGIEIANAEQYKEYVPAVYTLYNDNTYGCYKEEVGNATVTMTPSELYESTEHSGKTGEYIYFCNLNLSTVLTLVKNDERYLLRVWRQVGDEPKVLLNELEEFTHDYFNMGSKSLKIDGFTTEQLYTHYGELNNWATKEAGSEQDVASKGRMVPDMFKHTDIDETTDVTYTVKLYVQDNKVVDAAQGVAPAGAPRRAQDNPQAYYVKRVEQSVRVSGVITGVDGIHSDAAVSSVRYVNVAGQVSDKPWSGVNMVVTTLADGTTRTSKIVR